jgi:CheY-like chemotaxis protein
VPTTILIVEDDRDLRQMFRTTLSLAGYRVQEANDGVEALHLLDNERPDLVVLDLGLPRVSGYVVRQEIAANAHTRDIPIVVVTASLAPDELDVACLLCKPVTPEQLLQTVAECLMSGGGSARHRSPQR